MNLISLVLLASAFLILFASAELIYRFLKPGAESTRKIVHIGTGLLTMLFPIFLQSHWEVLLLCGSFLVLLILSMKFKFLPSINNIERKSKGSLYYPIIVYLVFCAYEWKSELIGVPDYLYFYLPILLMALCDPLAAYVGSNWPIKSIRPNRDPKSIGGCLAFLTGAILLSILFYIELRSIPFSLALLMAALLIGTTSMIAEMFSRSGSDNFFIPTTSLAAVIVCDFTLFQS